MSRSRRDEYADEYDDRPRRARRPSFACPYCGSDAPPLSRSKVSAGGWVVFIVLLLGLCTLPLCWIGLLIRDGYRVCGDCGTTLG